MKWGPGHPDRRLSPHSVFRVRNPLADIHSADRPATTRTVSHDGICSCASAKVGRRARRPGPVARARGRRRSSCPKPTSVGSDARTRDPWSTSALQSRGDSAARNATAKRHYYMIVVRRRRCPSGFSLSAVDNASRQSTVIHSSLQPIENHLGFSLADDQSCNDV